VSKNPPFIDTALLSDVGRAVISLCEQQILSLHSKIDAKGCQTKITLVCRSGMVETPRLQAKKSSVVAKRLVIPASEPESRKEVRIYTGCRIKSGMRVSESSALKLSISIN
jgi:hypothetical protein